MREIRFTLDTIIMPLVCVGEPSFNVALTSNSIVISTSICNCNFEFVISICQQIQRSWFINKSMRVNIYLCLFSSIPHTHKIIKPLLTQKKPSLSLFQFQSVKWIYKLLINKNIFIYLFFLIILNWERMKPLRRFYASWGKKKQKISLKRINIIRLRRW